MIMRDDNFALSFSKYVVAFYLLVQPPCLILLHKCIQILIISSS